MALDFAMRSKKKNQSELEVGITMHTADVINNQYIRYIPKRRVNSMHVLYIRVGPNWKSC